MVHSLVFVQRQPTQQISSREELVVFAIAFLLPFTLLFELEIIGTLYLHDLVSPVLLIVLLGTRGQAASLRPLRTFLLLLLLWFAGAILTDIYRDTAFADYARGWSRIVLFGINTVMLWLLSSGQLRILAAYTFSAGVALIAKVYLMPTEYVQLAEDPWKFGVGGGLLFIIGALSVSRRLQDWTGGYLPAVLIALVSVLSLIQNSRSLFAIGALAAVYVAFGTWASKHPRVARIWSPALFIALILASVAAVQLLVGVYSFAAEAGYLGEAARQKFLMQTSGDVSLLVGGRPEFLASTQAIADSPILGHGSWAQDPYYVYIYYSRLLELGLTIQPSFHDFGAEAGLLIPSHSHLFGAWVEAGLLGAIVWFWILLLSLQALYSVVKVRVLPNALVTITALMVLWDVLFSPFAGEARVIRAVQVCILIAAVRALAPQMQRLRALARGANRPIQRTV
jgi:hypothetical protein